MTPSTLDQRSELYAALGDPVRLAIVDALAASDRSPTELLSIVEIESNLLAHHLDVLEAAGLITRLRSSGDGRRRYVQLVHENLVLSTVTAQPAGRALFVCTRNSARSQLASVLWRSLTDADADSAGTNPAVGVHNGARAAANRAGLDLGSAKPKTLDQVVGDVDVVITVCDQAHEALGPDRARLHWSIPDPVAIGGRAAFDATVAHLRKRIRQHLGLSKGSF